MNKYIEDFRFEDGVLHVRLSGEFPMERLHKGQNLFQPLVDACATHKCDKALIDARDLQVNMDTLEMFQAGEDVVSVTSKGLRTAILAREDMLDRFFEDVAVNRGAIVKVFTDLETARDWLEKQ
jgi:hypothetical protein